MKNLISPLIIFISLLFTACIETEDINSTPEISTEDMTLETIVVPTDFDYSTTQDITVQLTAPSYLSNATFSLVAYKPETDSTVFATSSFFGSTYFESDYTIAAYIDTVMLSSNYMGMPSGIKIPIVSGKVQLDIENISRGEEKSAGVAPPYSKSAQANSYVYLGDYSFYTGLPRYLTDPDEITQDFLDDINATLPEYNRIPESSPELLADGTVTRIEVTKQADVWVTFVSEGAGYKNALGYYTYKVGEEPQSKDEIDTRFIIFPNASFAGSGGGLKSGDKVHLGQFEANTVIEWFLVSNAFYYSVSTSAVVHYSQSQFNIESEEELRSHMVMLWDEQRELFVLAFEDMRRDASGCDDDFNDVIFYATSNPVDAVKRTNVQEVKTATDSDNDGVNDSEDEYPEDPNKAFNNYSPGMDIYGGLAYEDLWPSKGDYDFNDLLLTYNYNLIANGQNKITSIEATFSTTHIGGSLSSAFAFSLPIEASQIESIENQELSSGFISTNANGTESGVDEAVIFVYDNARQVLDETIELIINFKTPIDSETLGTSPFNPFIVINEERAREVHLPDLPPTSKGLIYLGQNDDNSNAEAGKYYRTENNLPWALNFFTTFSPPAEKQSIDKLYDKFIPWATSGGEDHKDWYNND